MVRPSRDDRRWMRRAVVIGARGTRRVRPNPKVGCVLVRDGEEVGVGWHAQVGGPHAEVEALRAAGERALGATAYVTLEPCNHHGRTPPCAEALLAAGVSRVVIGVADPHPIAAGGAAWLAGHGVEVHCDVERDACAILAEEFLTNIELGRPLVQLKMASTLDGRAAAADGSSRWVTGPEARKWVHQMRAEADAVLVGSGTVLQDNPQLSSRAGTNRVPQPLRVVLDRRGRLSAGSCAESLALADTSNQRTVLYSCWPERLEAWAVRGAQIRRWPGEPDELLGVLRDLQSLGVYHVLCEGGPTLAAALLRAALVDRLDWLVAPKLLGAGPAAVGALGAANIAHALQFRIDTTRRRGDDVHLVLRPQRRP